MHYAHPQSGLVMTLLVDHTARNIAITRWALPECLHVPIAAVDEDAICTYIGTVDRVVSGQGLRKALLVTVPEPRQIDSLLPINDHRECGYFLRPPASVGPYRISAISRCLPEGVSR
jgi:hypothetical protein